MARNLGFRQVLALLLVLLFYALTMSAKGMLQEMNTQTTRWLLVFFIVVAVISIIIIYYNYNSKYERHPSATSNRSSRVDKVEHLLEEFALPIGVFVFGGGAIILRLFYLIADFQCIQFYVPPRNNTSDSVLYHVWNDMKSQKKYNEMYRLSDSISRIMMNLAILLFFCIQVPFLNRLHSLKYIRMRYFLHQVVLLIAGADVAVWLYVFFKESGLIRLDDITYGDTSLEITKTLETACLNYSSAIDIYLSTSMEHNLFPFTMEFMIASLEVLLNVWLLPKRPLQDLNVAQSSVGPQELAQPVGEQPQDPLRQDEVQIGPNIHNQDESEQVENDTDGLIEGQDDREHSAYVIGTVRDAYRFAENNQAVVINRWWHKLYCRALKLMCNIYTALLFSLLEILLLQYYILNYKAMKPREKISSKLYEGKDYVYMSENVFDQTVNKPVVLFRITFIASPALWASVHCAYILSTSRIVRPGESRLNASYVVLAIAIGGVVLLSGFQFVVCVIKIWNKGLEHSGYLMGMVEALIYVPQFMAQGLLLYFGQRRLPCRAHRFYETLQGRLTYLAMFNFIHWFIDSFLEIEFLSLRNDLKTKDGNDDLWQAFVHLFLPPCIYFRYISSLLILRVKRLVNEKEQPDVERNEEQRTNNTGPARETVSLSTQYGTIHT